MRVQFVFLVRCPNIFSTVLSPILYDVLLSLLWAREAAGLQPTLVYRAQPILSSSSLCISNVPPPPSLSLPFCLLQHPLICPTVSSLAGQHYWHLTGEEYGNIVENRRKLVEETCCSGFMVIPLWSWVGSVLFHVVCTKHTLSAYGMDYRFNQTMSWIL